MYGRRGVSQKALVSAVGRVAEKKYRDAFFTTLDSFVTPINSDGRIFDITNIPQGTLDTSRVGDKVTVNSIEMKVYLWADPVATPKNPNQAYRFVLFKWYDDTTPIVGDILQSLVGGNYAGIVAPFDHDKKIKRKILADFTITMFRDIAANTSIRASWSSPCYEMRFVNLKNKNMRVRQIAYQTGLTTGVGKFYVLAISTTDPGNDAFDPAHYSLMCRVNYIDM